jgi:hypothetical protein
MRIPVHPVIVPEKIAWDAAFMKIALGFAVMTNDRAGSSSSAGRRIPELVMKKMPVNVAETKSRNGFLIR